jgi:FtsH-binding integral membrane protein
MTFLTTTRWLLACGLLATAAASAQAPQATPAAAAP